MFIGIFRTRNAKSNTFVLIVMPMTDYGIYLSTADDTEGFRLPVNPSEIEMRGQGQGVEYTVLKLGEINVIKEPRLTEIKFGSIFPAQRYPFVVGQTLLEPLVYVNLIEKWKAEQRVARLIVVGGSLDINMTVSIEDFTWRERAGSSDIEYEILLKRYVYHAPKRVIVRSSQQTNTITVKQTKKPRPVSKQQPRTYTLVAGDNLWKIAKKFLGDGSRWREIATLNGIKDSEVRRLPIGLTIKLPNP